MDTLATVQHHAGASAAAGLQAQAQTKQGDGQKPAADFSLLKDEKAVQNAAREFSQADKAAIAPSATAPVDLAEVTTGSMDSKSSLPLSERSPNWSNLSASSKGYTMAERAINLYRDIYAMAV